MKRKTLVLLSLLLVGLLVFAGCSNEGKETAPADEPAPAEQTKAEPAKEPEKEPAKETAEAVVETPEAEVEDEASMDEWEGQWNNMGAYLDDPELEAAFNMLAEKEGVSVEEAKAAYVEKRNCEFNGLIIQGDKVTFLDAFPEKGGNTLGEATYAYKETFQVKHGNFDIQWHAFEAEGEAPYKVLLMMPVHGEEALTHFHLRYGDDAKALTEREGWYPTFVKPGSTYDQLTEEITE